MSTLNEGGVRKQDNRSFALAMAGRGYKIVPLPPREKFPKGLAEWQKKATCDVLQIEKWFKDPEIGIGWAMGTQPNGLNLAGIDVDVADGKQGWASLRALDVQFGLRPMIKSTITSVTGSDGRHLIVSTGPTVVTNGKLGAGLDLRGEGGFLVAPPSIHPNGQAYRWVEGKAPWELEPFTVSEEFAEYLCNPQAPEPAAVQRADMGSGLPIQVLEGHNHVERHSNVGDDCSPADYARSTFRIPDLLIEGGWSYVENKGDDSYWTRPDKRVRDGHSAVLHGEAPLVVWSTACPAPFWRAGRDARDGSRVLSPIEVLAAVRYSGDVQAAARELRKAMPKQAAVAVPTTTASPVDGLAKPGLNLPDEFWAARPILQHIHQAAHSRLVSPDATLLGVLARFAAIVPPSVQLPPLVGSTATFDFIGCSVASSSGGKSIANQVARELVPVDRHDVMMDQPVGSGEGLVQSFMVDEIGDDGKKTGRQVVGKAALHLTADEGTVLVQQQNRKGTTIVQTLCSAWSGQELGQANASAETRRIIAAKRVRVAAVINIQVVNGHLLLDDASMGIGLPSRVTFAYAHTKLPDRANLPRWPGPLRVSPPPVITGKVSVVEVAPEIEDEIISQRIAVARLELVLGPLDGHLTLMRLKIAGLLAMLDGRMGINGEDWNLAGTMISSSTAVRQLLLDTKVETDRVRVATMGVAQASRDLAAEDFKERQKIDRLTSSMIAKVPDEGIGANQLRKKVCSTDTKHRFDAALELAVARGALRLVEGRIERVLG